MILNGMAPKRENVARRRMQNIMERNHLNQKPQHDDGGHDEGECVHSQDTISNTISNSKDTNEEDNPTTKSQSLPETFASKSSQLKFSHEDNRLFKRSSSNTSSNCKSSSPQEITPLLSHSSQPQHQLLHTVTNNQNSSNSNRRMQCTAINNDSKNDNNTINSNTSHAQSLILGLAFAAIWSPQNLMAPNLTQMASYYNFTTTQQRDLYLGANIAFATAVLSLPLSAIIGFIADVVPSRRNLYAMTVLIGGVSTICGGFSTTYKGLYISRFICGGCMSGSTPIAFSLLGDFFHPRQRNAASSGLTACMGGGIILGQLYSGTVGDLHGWKYPFVTCGIIAIVFSVLILYCVEEPVRGGKEVVLQQYLSRGKTYNRKLSWEKFIKAMRGHPSNTLLIWSGFTSSIPWGIIFTFLNDYLSQECGLSVPDATYLVMVFGIGAAIGGILGGWIGQYTTSIHPGYMPIFMSVSTFIGAFPFIAMLNTTFKSASALPCFYALSGGVIANLPGVNVRPALINVNLPEMRGATLTAANLVINLARGGGPMILTTISGLYHISRQMAFNLLLIVFWIITCVIYLWLAKTLPEDQELMEKELASYATVHDHEENNADLESRFDDGPHEGDDMDGNGTDEFLGACTTSWDATDNARHRSSSPMDNASGMTLAPSTLRRSRTLERRHHNHALLISGNVGDGSNSKLENDISDSVYAMNDDETVTSLVSIEDRITSFDAEAAKESLMFFEEVFREIGEMNKNRSGGSSDEVEKRRRRRRHTIGSGQHHHFYQHRHNLLCGGDEEDDDEDEENSDDPKDEECESSQLLSYHLATSPIEDEHIICDAGAVQNRLEPEDTDSPPKRTVIQSNVEDATALQNRNGATCSSEVVGQQQSQEGGKTEAKHEDHAPVVVRGYDCSLGQDIDL